jgi:hypothetical protein
MTVQTDSTKLDAEIVAARKSGMSLQSISFCLEVSRRRIYAACQHMAPANVLAKDKTQHDSEIRRMAGQSMTYQQIADVLGLHRWIVDATCKRLRLSKRNEQHDSPIRYDEKPLVQKTCPVCRKKHMSIPQIWTCEPCKAKQECENAAGCGDWY